MDLYPLGGIVEGGTPPHGYSIEEKSAELASSRYPRRMT
jgi:hypothetical protein